MFKGVQHFRSFLVGFVLQFLFSLIFFYNMKAYMNQFQTHVQNFNMFPRSFAYDETLSNKMIQEVKVLCMVMTHKKTQKEKKAFYVQSTWGRRCNKLLFFSSRRYAYDGLDIVVSPFQESRDALWRKTKFAFIHVYKNYIDEYDWFIKADDDTYLIVENLRYLLAQYNPKTALFLGHRYAVEGIHEGYMAGGGYILSKKALQKFSERIANNASICNPNGGDEDWRMGICLSHSAIFVDCRDEFLGKRFFPVGTEGHMILIEDPKHWYTKRQYYHSPESSTKCCSDTSVQFHYISPTEMLAFEYYIYNVHPFGLEDHSDEVVPRKKSLKEVIAASDARSPSVNFKNHTDYYNLDSSEYD